MTFVSGDQFGADPARDAEREVCSVALFAGPRVLLGLGRGSSGSMHVTPVAGDEAAVLVPDHAILA